MVGTRYTLDGLFSLIMQGGYYKAHKFVHIHTHTHLTTHTLTQTVMHTQTHTHTHKHYIHSASVLFNHGYSQPG